MTPATITGAARTLRARKGGGLTGEAGGRRGYVPARMARGPVTPPPSPRATPAAPPSGDATRANRRRKRVGPGRGADRSRGHLRERVPVQPATPTA